MITLHLTTDDLLKIRFAYTPLMEITMSFRVLLDPKYQPPFRAWVDDAMRALHDVDLTYLRAVLGYKRYVPDFLTPTPYVTNLSIEADFDRVLATPDDFVRRDIFSLIHFTGESEELCHFIAEPKEAVKRLVEEMRIYWKRTLEAHWTKMQSVLENDIRYRAQRLTLGGTGYLFDELHPLLRYRGDELIIDKTSFEFCIYKQEYDLEGYGIQLVPVLFGYNGLHWQPNQDAPFMLEYGARGSGLWYAPEPAPSMEALEMTLGVGKARILQSLINSQSTSELARNLQLTAGAVSQQLGKLNQAGLVESHRQGKSVYYRLSTRGANLIDLFSA